jgi:hypothetical protein
MKTSTRLLMLTTALLTALAPTVTARAVSDGDYNNARQGCTGDAFNSNEPNRTEPHCYMVTAQISDGTHNYLTVGVPETADGHNPSSIELCLDLGQGRDCALFSKKGVTQEPAQPGTAPNPSTGLRFYFGVNDNIDSGEHDSSSQVNNGPSDGGGIQANASPKAAQRWLTQISAGNKSFFLTHPLPGADAGMGFCADGFCFSAQSQRRVMYRGGDRTKHHDAANYQGKRWDPESCAGPSDGPKDCGGHDLQWWNDQDGTVYAEPGIQIYEDPDPQGSPIGPWYPIPAIYVGTCGLIVGGGPLLFPASPFTNKAGQIVVSTGC